MLLHKHNLETYRNLVDMFQKYNRVAVVQPTGTGKSFLMLQLIADNSDKQFLIASPSTYIFSQIQTHAENYQISLDNCSYMTYAKLASLDDLIVIISFWTRYTVVGQQNGARAWSICWQQNKTLRYSALLPHPSAISIHPEIWRRNYLKVTMP